MKKEELFEALADVDEESVAKAGEYSAAKKNPWRRWTALAACAVLLIAVAGGISLWKGGNQVKPGEGEAGVITGGTVNDNTDPATGVRELKAVYPEPVAANMSANAFMNGDAHYKWWQEYRKNLAETQTLNKKMNSYYASLMEKVLVSEDENTVCSPLNTYIAFAMLAEVSDGNTRQQILDMLGASDIKALRKDVSALWENNYIDTPILKSLLANSIWLSDSVGYNDETLRRLADTYYASSFRGEPGSSGMDEALRAWTDENTGGLLKEFTQNMSMDQDTVLEILSTIYYKAMWVDLFYENNTAEQTFHGTKGDTTVDMMHRMDVLGVYRTDAFTSLGLNLNDSGAMYFFLPNEGTDVNDLASNPDIWNALHYDENDRNRFYPLVDLYVPKFRVSCKTDLISILPELGVTDALDFMVSDFTPLTTEKDNLFLSKAEHAAMVEIDEHGVTGAAYTELALAEGAALPDEEITFVLDRPFLFIVTAGDGSALFSGIVRNIE